MSNWEIIARLITFGVACFALGMSVTYLLLAFNCA